MFNKKTNTRSSLKNFWYFCKLSLKESPWTFSTLIISTALAGILPVIASKFFGKLIDEVVRAIQIKSDSAVWLALIVYIIVRTIPPIIDTVRDTSFRFWYLKFSNVLEVFLLRKRGNFDIAHLEDPIFQDKLIRAFNNGNSPIFNLVEVGISNIHSVFAIITSALAILLIDWRIFFIIVIFSIPSFITESRYGKRLWSINQENSRENREYQHIRHFFTSKYYLIEAKLLGVQEKFLSMVKKTLEHFTGKQMAEEKKTTTNRILSELLSSLGILVSIFLAIKGSTTGAISVGTIVFLFSVIGSLESSISLFFIRTARMNERNLYVSDILDIIETKSVIINQKQPKAIADVVPEIEFKNIYFKYPGKDNWILENISFKIKPGEKIGLVGHNGAGKTTLVRLLLRIHDPSKGEILINGVNLKDLDFKEWWEKIAVLPQDFSAFHFSAKETIAYGDIKHALNIDLVKDSAKMSTADSFIEAWKDKYDTTVGVEFGGEELSKGERQKMALSRIFYRNSHFTVLDEPTASVDAASASKIFENIRNMPKEKSALLISHNFATIKLADRIILLEHGKILEEGTHKQLMKLKGSYATLYKQQESDFSN
jgi:ATP-binding cassette, subfamily B, bacterial